MAFYKISDDTDNNFSDIQIHGRKYIANIKVPMVIGTDAAQTFEDGIKIVSVPVPTNRKLRLVKINWSIEQVDTITRGSNIDVINNSLFHPRYNSFSIVSVSADDENSFTNTVVDGDAWLARQSEKFYIRLQNEHYEYNHNVIYFNSEIFNNNKLSYLNTYTRFGFKKGTVYADYNAALLAYYKTFDAGVTAAVPSAFRHYLHIEMDILPDEKKRPFKRVVRR